MRCTAITICASTVFSEIFNISATSLYFNPSSLTSLYTILHLGGSQLTAVSNAKLYLVLTVN